MGNMFPTPGKFDKQNRLNLNIFIVFPLISIKVTITYRVATLQLPVKYPQLKAVLIEATLGL